MPHHLRHHDEIKTTNQNWVVGLDYAINANWSVPATIPVVDRDHQHVHNHHGTQLTADWSAVVGLSSRF